MLEKLLERMATSEDTTLVIKREGGGKMRVASRHWEEAEVTGKNEMLEVRSVDGRLDVARKERKPYGWGPPVEPYDPYGPTTESSMSDTSQADGVTRHSSVSDYRP